MRTWKWWAGGLLLLAVFAGRKPDLEVDPTARGDPPNGQVYEPVADDMRFAYGAAARFNERLLGTIDAIDTALTAILAGDVAVVVFVIDKIADLQPQREIAATVLLCGSILACATGYVFGFRPHGGHPDGVRPRAFFADFSTRPDESMVSAIEQLIAASEMNMAVRFGKRMLSGCALLLLLAGLAAVGVARFRQG